MCPVTKCRSRVCTSCFKKVVGSNTSVVVGDPHRDDILNGIIGMVEEEGVSDAEGVSDEDGAEGEADDYNANDIDYEEDSDDGTYVLLDGSNSVYDTDDDLDASHFEGITRDEMNDNRDSMDQMCPNREINTIPLPPEYFCEADGGVYEEDSDDKSENADCADSNGMQGNN